MVERTIVLLTQDSKSEEGMTWGQMGGGSSCEDLHKKQLATSPFCQKCPSKKTKLFNISCVCG